MLFSVRSARIELARNARCRISRAERADFSFLVTSGLPAVFHGESDARARNVPLPRASALLHAVPPARFIPLSFRFVIVDGRPLPHRPVMLNDLHGKNYTRGDVPRELRRVQRVLSLHCTSVGARSRHGGAHRTLSTLLHARKAGEAPGSSMLTRETSSRASFRTRALPVLRE